MRESLADYCRRTGREDLLNEWDSARNLPFTPNSISYGSKKHVWWRCANGHSWRAAVHTRNGAGSGCPYCAGRLPIVGENDLATKYPDLAKEWLYEKNGSLTPDQVLPGSHRLVWWRCDKGHEWQAQIKSRVNGTGCPICDNKQVQAGDNDLQSLYPTLAKEWHPTKNGELAPADVVPGTRRKVWWRCEKGHDYQAVISSRTMRGGGCPYCANKKVLVGYNDLATLYPAVAKEWHPTLNGPLTPQDVTPGSRRRVWWQCSAGHTWQAVIYSRTGTQQCGCPVCSGHASGKRRARYEQLDANSIHPNKG